MCFRGTTDAPLLLWLPETPCTKIFHLLNTLEDAEETHFRDTDLRFNLRTDVLH